MLTLKQKIKVELAKKDLTGGDVAKAIGIDRPTFWYTVYGRLKKPEIRKGICKYFGFPKSVWDDVKRPSRAA